MKKGVMIGLFFVSFYLYSADQKEAEPAALTVVVDPVRQQGSVAQHIRKPKISCSYQCQNKAIILLCGVGLIANFGVFFYYRNSAPGEQHSVSLPMHPFVQINNCCGKDLLIPRDKIGLIASVGALRKYCQNSPRIDVERSLPNNFNGAELIKMCEDFDLEKAAREHAAQLEKRSWWERLAGGLMRLNCSVNGHC